MKCLACGNTLPNDSEFCQYCGEKIVIPTEASPQGYCKCCGAMIEMGENTASGKKSSKAGKIVIVGLTIVCVALGALNVIQYNKNVSLENQNAESQQALIEVTETAEKYEMKIKNLEGTVSTQKKEIAELNATVRYLWDRNAQLYKEQR